MFLPGVDLDPRSRLHLVERPAREPAVRGEGGDAEEHVPVDRVGEPAGEEGPDDVEHLGDRLRRAWVVVGPADVQGAHFPQKAVGVPPSQRLNGRALDPSGLDDAVFDIREVLDVFDLVPPILEVPPDDIEDEIRQGVPDVGWAVEVGAAHVHPHMPRLERHELLHATGERVVDPQAHRSARGLEQRPADRHRGEFRHELPPARRLPRP